MKLKQLFNEMIGKLGRIKASEMNLLKQRNERLQRIHDDINILERLIGKTMTQFKPIPKLIRRVAEDPESLFETDDNDELNKQKSQQDQKSMHINRQQSFYDRALDEMMNGVLEVCWEDELKKDIPMPTCLQQQSSDGTNELTESQRKQIKLYMEMIEKLRNDRIAYIAKLFDEEGNLMAAREHQIRQVNRCIENISKSRVLAEFAICMEQMNISMCNMNRSKWLEFGEREQLLL